MPTPAAAIINLLQWHDKQFGLETLCVGAVGGKSAGAGEKENRVVVQVAGAQGSVHGGPAQVVE